MNDFDEIVSLRDSHGETAIDELVLRCSTDVAAVRRAAPRATRHEVTVFPGDICQRRDPIATLHTTELGEHTLAGIAERPIMVGSVFQLRFDASSLDAPPALATCERCAMLTESSFELRLRFAHPLPLVDPGA